MINKQPLCSAPKDGSMSTASGYRLCVNPEHRSQPDCPQWHKDWVKT